MSTNNIKDYYYILGLNKNASKDDIKKAYRKLSLKFHPDQNSGDKFFEERFKDLHEAYETLVDDEKRKLYDDQLSGRYSESYSNAYTSYTASPPPPKKKKSNNVVFTILGGLLFASPFLIKLAANKINEEDSKKSKKYYDTSRSQVAPLDSNYVTLPTKDQTATDIPLQDSGGAPSATATDPSTAGTQNNNSQSTEFADGDGYIATDYVKYFFKSLSSSDCHSAFYVTANPLWDSRGESWFCSSEAFGSVRNVVIREIYALTQTFDEAEIYVAYYAEDNANGNKCFKQNITLRKVSYTDNKSRWRIIKMKNVEEPVICDEN